MTPTDRATLLGIADAMDAIHSQGIESKEEWQRRYVAHAKAAAELRAFANRKTKAKEASRG